MAKETDLTLAIAVVDSSKRLCACCAPTPEHPAGTATAT
jgi:hypothetical protein